MTCTVTWCNSFNNSSSLVAMSMSTWLSATDEGEKQRKEKQNNFQWIGLLHASWYSNAWKQSQIGCIFKSKTKRCVEMVFQWQFSWAISPLTFYSQENHFQWCINGTFICNIIQGLVDLWVMGIHFAWFIYTKSMLGCMGIYGDIYHPWPFHKLWRFYITLRLSINPHKSKRGFIINKFCEMNPHKSL